MPPTIAGKNAAAKEASDSEPHAPRDHSENLFWLLGLTYSRPRKERVRSRVSSRRRVDDRIVPERQHYVRLPRVTGHL